MIQHPELLDRDTLYELRSLLALHPYYQPVRLLMLRNLHLLHDVTFDEELRRAALYITDRRTIFNMVEGMHYNLQSNRSTQSNQSTQKTTQDRTVDLIDNFLDSVPADESPTANRKPTPADAAVDYVAYLLESESLQDSNSQSPHMKGQDLIDNFLEQEQGRIHLADLPQEQPADDLQEMPEAEDNEEEYFTETLARIYIKQGHYQKAHDIIGRLNQQFPHKNAYFADQMRFLEKLIINSKNNSKN